MNGRKITVTPSCASGHFTEPIRKVRKASRRPGIRPRHCSDVVSASACSSPPMRPLRAS
jgi:hypothetical protein